MLERLNIGLLQLEGTVAERLTELLIAQGHRVQTINWFDLGLRLDVTFFIANGTHLESFLANKSESVWIGLEDSFLEPRFSALLELGVHDVLMIDELQGSELNRVLLRAFHRREIVKSMSTHDTLTGSLNAEGFAAHVDQAIQSLTASGRAFGVCSVDVIAFQKINEEHGYAVANQLLCMIAQRLSLIVGGRFTVGRLGGDEFLLLLENLTDKNDLNESLDHVRSAFTAPFELFGRRIFLDVFIGAILYPETVGQAEELIAQAHEAMSTGKRYRQPVFLYDRNTTPWFQMDMVAEIRRALRENEFQLHYQPRMHLQQGKVVGMEALIRWKHPVYGDIPPSEFIYVAENSGMILPLGNWILSQAEQDVLYLARHGLGDLAMAINLSFKQLQDSKFCENLPGRIRRWRGNHASLEFELTETAVLNNPDEVRATLEAVHEQGVRISLDDFGTGYSALVHIQEFPISTVKIDKSFVQRMLQDQSALNIVESMVNFAHRLNLDVVGEGIEQEEQLAQLRAMGCEQGQGYYFSKAVPIDALIRFAQKTNQIPPQSQPQSQP